MRSIRQPVRTLSGGQRQSVAVAKAVMWNSKLVILDEPTAALGVAQTRMVLDLVKRLKDHGLAVMVISHNLNDVFEVADRIAILHLGRMVVQDKAVGVRPPARRRLHDHRRPEPRRRGRARGGTDMAGVETRPERERPRAEAEPPPTSPRPRSSHPARARRPVPR